MEVKISLIIACWLLSASKIYAQNIKKQTDKHIVHQQERMVHKEWNRKKFTPTKGFLGLNYNYWLTWAWHPNYPKTDRRPLSVAGPQTLRMAFVLALQQTDQSYKSHSDTIGQNARRETINYSGSFSDVDPLWQLYYRREFAPLINTRQESLLSGTTNDVAQYLKDKGLYDWYIRERMALQERLQAARSTNMDRGSRMLTYHRLIYEMRKLNSAWESKKLFAKKFIDLSKKNDLLTKESANFSPIQETLSDIEIADRILRQMYSIN